jgi:glutathione S-transferase
LINDGEPKSLDAALIIAQTANVLFYLGPRLKLSPCDEAGRLWAHQLQLTITDLVVEIHHTHRPISSGLYYEQQKLAAKRRGKEFWQHRVSKLLGLFRARVAEQQQPLSGRTPAHLRRPLDFP